MLDPDIMTHTIPVSQARQKLGELVNAVYKRHVRVVVEKSGIPVVAMVSLRDLERWTRLDREREERFKVLDDIRAKNANKTAEEVERDVAEEIAALRQEKRGKEPSPTRP